MGLVGTACGGHVAGLPCNGASTMQRCTDANFMGCHLLQLHIAIADLAPSSMGFAWAL